MRRVATGLTFGAEVYRASARNTLHRWLGHRELLLAGASDGESVAWQEQEFDPVDRVAAGVDFGRTLSLTPSPVSCASVWRHIQHS